MPSKKMLISSQLMSSSHDDIKAGMAAFGEITAAECATLPIWKLGKIDPRYKLLVDQELHEYLSQFSWKICYSSGKISYVFRCNKHAIGDRHKPQHILIHSEVAHNYGITARLIKHINGNKLDNRLKNLSCGATTKRHAKIEVDATLREHRINLPEHILSQSVQRGNPQRLAAIPKFATKSEQLSAYKELHLKVGLLVEHILSRVDTLVPTSKQFQSDLILFKKMHVTKMMLQELRQNLPAQLLESQDNQATIDFLEKEIEKLFALEISKNVEVFLGVLEELNEFRATLKKLMQSLSSIYF